MRYELRRARWDRALAAFAFIILLIVGATVGVFEFLLAMGFVVFASALSEWSSRLLNYVILHRDHVDIREKPWFAKTRGQKWRIPYRDIVQLDLDEITAAITILHGKATRFPQGSDSEAQRVSFRLRSFADAEEVRGRITEARQLAESLGL